MQAGELIFFDAIPLRPVQLRTEIMTPHMGKWYEQGGDIEGGDILKHPECIPADWHDPNPIFFLVVERATFLFSVALRNPAVKNCDLAKVLLALEQSLQWLGAGAKTATGYGRMGRDENHPFLAENLPLKEQARMFVATWAIDMIPTKVGKDYNKTKDNICSKYGNLAWSIAVNTLWERYGEELSSWAKSDDKNKKKAFNKIIQDKNAV
jgi:CRISPR-associated protein Cmr6